MSATASAAAVPAQSAQPVQQTQQAWPKAIFSTNLGQRQPRECKPPFPPVVVRGDPDRLTSVKDCAHFWRSKYPFEYMQIFFTTTIEDLWDDWDIHIDSPQFLRDVIRFAALENLALAQQFAYDYSENNDKKKLEAIVWNIGYDHNNPLACVYNFYSKAEIDQYGAIFLWHATNMMAQALKTLPPREDGSKAAVKAQGNSSAQAPAVAPQKTKKSKAGNKSSARAKKDAVVANPALASPKVAPAPPPPNAPSQGTMPKPELTSGADPVAVPPAHSVAKEQRTVSQGAAKVSQPLDPAIISQTTKGSGVALAPAPSNSSRPVLPPKPAQPVQPNTPIPRNAGAGSTPYNSNSRFPKGRHASGSRSEGMGSRVYAGPQPGPPPGMISGPQSPFPSMASTLR